MDESRDALSISTTEKRPTRLGLTFALVFGVIAGCAPTEGDEGGGSSDAYEYDVDGDDESVTKIVGGQRTNGFPAVGIFETNAGSWCTGTLITPRAVLTAAHCIDSKRGTFKAGGRYYRWSNASRHPSYNGSEDNDVAVAVLETAVSGIAPARLGASAPSRGDNITLVGYGWSSFSGGNEAGNKYAGTNDIAGVGAGWFSYKGNANNCSGDSGGPSFHNGVVIGVHSSGVGNAYCSTTGYDARVDRNLGFIKAKAPGVATQ